MEEAQQTQVVNKHHGKPFDTYIGRGSLWGNPFPLTSGSDEDRAAVILAYEKYLLTRRDLLAQVGHLYGRTLACFCAPKPCHGDVLAHYAEALATTGKLPPTLAYAAIYPQPVTSPGGCTL